MYVYGNTLDYRMEVLQSPVNFAYHVYANKKYKKISILEECNLNVVTDDLYQILREKLKVITFLACIQYNIAKMIYGIIHENSEGLSSATNHKTKGQPSHCLLRQTYIHVHQCCFS